MKPLNARIAAASCSLTLAVLLVAQPASAQECPGWADHDSPKRLADSEISESSGLAMSRVNADRLWTHNDSGDSARLFLIDEEGATRATVMLEGVDARDWEDMAAGPCGAAGTPENDTPCLYVADIGDNLAVLDEVVIHRFAEPEIGPSTTTRVVSEIETLRVRYEDGARDAEALLVHPSGRLFIADKVEGGTVQIYEAPAEFGSTVTADVVATFQVDEEGDFGNLITAGAFSPDGTVAVLKSYHRLYTFCGAADKPIELLDSAPTESRAAPLIQGEALAYDVEENRIWLTSERIPAIFISHPREVSDTGESPDAGQGAVDAGMADTGQPETNSGDAEASPETDPGQGSKKESCQTANGRPGSMTFLAALLLSLLVIRRGRPIAKRRMSASGPSS